MAGIGVPGAGSNGELGTATPGTATPSNTGGAAFGAAIASELSRTLPILVARLKQRSFFLPKVLSGQDKNAQQNPPNGFTLLKC